MVVYGAMINIGPYAAFFGTNIPLSYVKCYAKKGSSKSYHLKRKPSDKVLYTVCYIQNRATQQSFYTGLIVMKEMFIKVVLLTSEIQLFD